MDSNRHAVAQPAAREGKAQPGLATYLAAAVVTMGIAAAELLLAGAGGPRLLLLPLALVSFVVAALFYQGLWHGAPIYKGIFAGGMFFGLLTVTSLVALLGFGDIVR